MTDEQIVKAWGKCIDVTSGCCGDDTTCPYCTDEEEGCAKCFEKLRIDVLALIKRQQAEIDHLREATKKVKSDLKYYLDTNEENGVVWIPKFTINNLVKEMTEKEGGKG